MLNGNGNENGKRTKINRSIYQKKTFFARLAHFFVHFFAVVVVT